MTAACESMNILRSNFLEKRLSFAVREDGKISTNMRGGIF
ncbi:hypothetical protein BVRB_2g029620 [Beta vulgaris subsp. vulgaris]|nr:hypothetical protein BVRB_2g029620 [Beta vulgaris subsp. vulgaris]